jgi:hypothetical protein
LINLAFDNEFSQVLLCHDHLFFIMYAFFKQQISDFLDLLLLLSILDMIEPGLVENRGGVVIAIRVFVVGLHASEGHRPSFVLWIHVVGDVRKDGVGDFDVVATAYRQPKRLKVQDPRLSLLLLILLFLTVSNVDLS